MGAGATASRLVLTGNHPTEDRRPWQCPIKASADPAAEANVFRGMNAQLLVFGTEAARQMSVIGGSSALSPVGDRPRIASIVRSTE
jgi:hypothetical protein